MKLKNSPLARTPPANLPVIPGVTAPKDANRKSPEKEHKESEMTHHLSTVTGVHFYLQVTSITFIQYCILQSLPKRRRKWINSTWTFEGKSKINRMQNPTQRYKKIFEKNHKKILPLFLSHVLLLFILLQRTYCLFCTQKYYKSERVIFDSKYTINADKLYHKALKDLEAKNTCVLMCHRIG